MDNRVLYSHSMSYLLYAVLSKASHTTYLAKQRLCLLIKPTTLIERSRRTSDLPISKSLAFLHNEHCFNILRVHLVKEEVFERLRVASRGCRSITLAYDTYIMSISK